MGQCQCMANSDAKNLEKRRNSDDFMKSVSTSFTSRKKKTQNLVTELQSKEYQNEDYNHLFTSKVKLENFEIQKVIGRGAYAKIYLVKKYHDVTDEEKFFAMKVLKKKMLFSKKQMHHTMQERKILMDITHPFIVKMHYAFQTPDRFYFVLDYVNGGDLFFQLRKKKKFSEADARLYICELLLALDHLHENNFIYRDLKLENILLDSEGHVKLTDFGLSKDLSNKATDFTYTFCGTPIYIAPEVIKRKGYNKMADWWALGILLHELVSGNPPYFDRNNKKVLQEIASKPYENQDSFSPALKDLLSKLLEKNPKKRLGAPELGGTESIKNHEFFNDIDWQKVYNKEYKAPVKPGVKKPSDTKNVDQMYLYEEIKNTPEEILSLEQLNKMHFKNFTYNEEDQSKSIRKKQQMNEVYDSYITDNSIHNKKVKELRVSQSVDQIGFLPQSKYNVK